MFRRKLKINIIPNIKGYLTAFIASTLLIFATGSADLLPSTPSADMNATTSGTASQSALIEPTGTIESSASAQQMQTEETDVPNFEEPLTTKISDSGPYFEGEIVINFNDATSKKDRIKLIRRMKSKVKRITNFGYYIVSTPLGDENKTINEYRIDPNIVSAEPNFVSKPQGWGGGGGSPVIGNPLCDPANDPYLCSGLQENLNQIEAARAWKLGNYSRGSSSTIIAIIDTGVDYNHSDLRDRIWRNPGESGNGKETNGIDDDGNGYADDFRGWDFVGNQQFPDNDPMDECSSTWHGTAVAGIAAATTNNRWYVAGVDWYARIMPLKAGNIWCDLDSSLIAEAIKYAVDNGADVINISSASSDSQALRNMVKYAWDNGVVVVASARYHNYDKNCDMLYPAGYDNVIAVGGLSSNQNSVAGCANTNYNPVRVVAPAQNLYSTVGGSEYVRLLSQTFPYSSLASPLAAGIASVMRGCYANHLTVRESFKYAVVDKGAAGYDTDYGYGMVNLYKQVRSACGL